MSCELCGKEYVSGLCKHCARWKDREGDAEAELGQPTTDGGQSHTAKLEATASRHANDALAAMDARETEQAVYHGRQFLQALFGLNNPGGDQ